MKRLFALIIIAVTVIPLFSLTINAEENVEIVLFENGQYKINFSTNVFSEEDNNFFINLLESHTGVPYDKNIVGNGESIIFFGSGNLVNSENEIVYSQRHRLFMISYDSSENREILFNKLTEKIQSLPKDKIVIDNTFFAIVKDPDLGNEDEENKKEDNVGENSSDEDNFFKNAGKFFKAVINFFDIFEVDNENYGLTLTSGGFNLIQPEGEFNEEISKLYKVIYPIGFAVMLICWCFGIAKSTISVSLDIKDKTSILYSVLSLIIGLAAMSLAPQILTLLTGISRSICEIISTSDAAYLSNEYVGQTNILDMIIGNAEGLVTLIIVILILELVFMVNILWLALLQCLSPIFIGLMANQNTRKISFNFIKEYFKALLIPIVTVCYWCLVSTFQMDFNNFGTGMGVITGLLGSIVLAISVVSIAGKKLDKLIN